MADRSKTSDSRKWPKPWRLRWYPKDSDIRGIASVQDSYYDTKEEAESNAPLAPWEVSHESECKYCGRSDVR